MNSLHRLFPFLILSSAALVFCSCASVSVRHPERSGAAQPKAPPPHIYLEPFSTERTQVKESFRRKIKGQLKAEAQQILTRYLVSELSKNVAPVTVIRRGAALPRSGWLVTGEITRVAEGSRLLRMGVGLGMGGTKMETSVAVRNLPASNPPFLRFQTTGGSNAMPGALTSPIPFSAGPTAILRSQDGVTDDSARTARAISGTLRGYMAERGWIRPVGKKGITRGS
jgi:hypothetical protein